MKWTVERKKLLKAGYTFHRLFADNRITYCKHFSEYSNVMIWVSLRGKSVSIKDWYQHSDLVFEHLCKIDYDSGFFGGRWNQVYLDRDESKILDLDWQEYNDLMAKMANKEIPFKHLQEIFVTEEQFEWIKKEIEFLQVTK